MTEALLIVGYIVGIIVWMRFEKKFFPYEEGEYTIEFDGAHEITEEMHNDRAIERSIIWPICLSLILVLLPFRALIWLFEKI